MTPNTKAEAYAEAKQSGRIGKHVAKIMECFAEDTDQWSREELSILTGIKVSSICGAVHPLVTQGKLVVRNVGVSLSGAKVQLLGKPLPHTVP